MNLFPAPVSGQPIPRGWFARLVRFMNTLILHGDGSYTQVKHTNDGTFVTLTPAAIDALNRASGRPGGSGGISQGVGAPDFSSPSAMSAGVQYGPFTYPVWIIGSVGAYLASDTIMECYLSIGGLYSPYLFRCTQNSSTLGYQISIQTSPVCMIIPKNMTFQLYTQGTSGNFDINLNIFPATLF